MCATHNVYTDGRRRWRRQARFATSRRTGRPRGYATATTHGHVATTAASILGAPPSDGLDATQALARCDVPVALQARVTLRAMPRLIPALRSYLPALRFAPARALRASLHRHASRRRQHTWMPAPLASSAQKPLLFAPRPACPSSCGGLLRQQAGCQRLAALGSEEEAEAGGAHA